LTIQIPKILPSNAYLGLPPLEQEKYVEKTIKEILHANPMGITITDITDSAPFTRPTILKQLERLVSCREGYKIKRGNVFVYYPNGKAAYPSKEIKLEISEKRSFKGTFLENSFGKFIFIEEDGNEGISGGGFLVKKEDFPAFMDFIQKLSKEQ
jgi:hypothetical protein